MKALIDAPRPLPALRLARRLERFLSADRDGLLFTLPLRAHADAVWNAGKPRLLLPSTQSVDAAGTYFDPRTDLITSALANRLRIGGIDKATKKQGALFEGARTNTCLQSEDFSTTWGTARASVTTNATTAPDGNTTADKLVEGTETNTHVIFQVIAVTSGQKIAISIFAKKAERKDILLQAFSTAAPANTNVWFNLDDGTKGTVGSGVDDSGIDALPNGWYRCWLVFTADATDNFNIDLVLGSGGETSFYEGDGSSGLFLWGAQCEQNVEFPGSYIKTTTAAVTRAKDVLNYDNTSEVNLKAAAGTVYLAISTARPADSTNAIFFDCRTDNRQDGFWWGLVGNTFRLQFFSSSVSVANLLSSTNPARGNTYVIAGTWKVNDFRLYIDGTEEANDTAGAVPTATDTIHLGSDEDQGDNYSGNLAHFHVYDSVHSAARILQNTNEIKAWLGI